MLYKEIIAVCSQIHTKHINTLCGQNVELLNGQPHVVACFSKAAMPQSLTSPRDQTPARNVPNPVRPFTARTTTACPVTVALCNLQYRCIASPYNCRIPTSH